MFSNFLLRVWDSMLWMGEMLYSHIQLHNTYTNISGNIVNNNEDFNERTNTLLYKNIPLTLYSRKGCERVDVGYVWEVSSRRGNTATYWPKVPLTIAVLLSHLSWAAQLWVTEGPKPSVCCWLSLLHHAPNWLQLQLELELNWLTQSICGTWLYSCPTSTCFLWAYASAPYLTTGQGDIQISSTGCTCLAVFPLIYAGVSLDWRSRVNMLQKEMFGN